jgi:hypothetical protein
MGKGEMVQNSGEKRPLGRTRSRLEDNIRMDLRETGWESVNCIHLAEDRDQWRVLVHMITNLGLHRRWRIS